MTALEPYPPELLERARKIKLLLLDCDGVLTDGQVYFLPLPDGSLTETKGFNTQDGIALQWAYRVGIETGIISGRGGLAVRERARSAKMRYLFEGNTQKLPLFEQVLSDSGYDAEQIAYVGDDLTDLPIMKRAGLAAAPPDSRREALEAAHFVTHAGGGRGCVRDVIELLLKSQQRWEEIVLASYDV